MPELQERARAPENLKNIFYSDARRARLTEETMEPYGDSNKSNSTRESRTKRELNEWRASEKPASGAPVHKEIKQPKPQKPKSDEPKLDEKTAAQVQTDEQSE